MSDATLVLLVHGAGGLHFVTLALAHLTPIPRHWDENLATLPEVHRRFAVAQNVFIGLVIAFCGTVSLALAPSLVGGSAPARALCLGTALWWGGRLLVLPWLRVWPELQSRLLRAGFVALHAQCAGFAAGYAWLALRR
jgi:hypothetical protein